jgi:CrcB protein
VRLGILIGVLGGYTTFSSFGRETLALANDGQYAAAAANVLLSNVLSLAGVWAGWATAVRLFGPGHGGGGT